VVDDGSDAEFAARLQKRCIQLGITYLATGADPGTPFNLARARNVGARYAKGRLLLFLDVDLLPCDGFYGDILDESALLGMDVHIDRFLMCPVIYLTQAGYEKIQGLPGRLRKAFAINAMLSYDLRYREKFSHGTSVILVNLHYYLCRGGQDERFEGWGYEDYEFTTRLMLHNPQFPLPENCSSMAGNFMTIDKYSGWKAAYRLHGDWLGSKGIYLLHMPHPVDRKYAANAARNQRRLEKRFRQGLQAEEPVPISYPEAGVSLLFRETPFCFFREFAPFLGRTIFANERSLCEAKSLASFLRTNHVSRVVFGNPYANDALLSIYGWCRKNRFPFVVCERGALPDSVFHDSGGFLCDSDSYSPGKWDKPLSKEQEERVTVPLQMK